MLFLINLSYKPHYCVSVQFVKEYFIKSVNASPGLAPVAGLNHVFGNAAS